MAAFNRDHLIIGALGFVLGSVVTTASITAVLMTQSKEEKVCPPVTAIVAPSASVEAAPATTEKTATTPPPVAMPTPASITPTVAPTPKTTTPPPPPVNTAKIKGLAGEEAERVVENQKNLEDRKKNLESQLKDSNEI
ncbi:MAG TPA: hypothetical protein PKL69_09895, partial [Agitococcus sp.]|nr:hypothetical protein [Agitococcus sp.]